MGRQWIHAVDKVLTVRISIILSGKATYYPIDWGLSNRFQSTEDGPVFHRSLNFSLGCIDLRFRRGLLTVTVDYLVPLPVIRIVNLNINLMRRACQHPQAHAIWVLTLLRLLMRYSYGSPYRTGIYFIYYFHIWCCM